MWVDIEKQRIDVEKQKLKSLNDIVTFGVNKLEEYYLKKMPKLVWPVYGIMGLVILASGYLTYQGRISGDTFAFLMGTIAGYLISVISKHT